MHNSQLTVKALRPLVLWQRWFSLGYLSLKDKTKQDSSLNSPENTRMKNQNGDSYTFNPKLKAWWFIFHISSLEKLEKIRQYKIIMQKYVNLSKELFNLFHELSRTQRNVSMRLKKKNHVKLIFSLKKKTCKFDSLSISRTNIGICSTINCNTRISKSYATKNNFIIYLLVLSQTNSKRLLRWKKYDKTKHMLVVSYFFVL